MQIKTTLRYHLTPVRMAKIKTLGTVHVGEDVEQEEHFSTVGGNADWYNHSGKQYGEFSENWESFFLQTQPYHSLGIYPKNAQSYHKDTCSTMFIAALFIIARTWKQPRCPSTEEWIRKMWFIYTMEYYAAEKNNDIMKFAGKWMELENVILRQGDFNKNKKILKRNETATDMIQKKTQGKKTKPEADQDCSLKIQEPDVPAPWFLDPGGWSKTAVVRLFFIFPGICILSLIEAKSHSVLSSGPLSFPFSLFSDRSSTRTTPGEKGSMQHEDFPTTKQLRSFQKILYYIFKMEYTIPSSV
ncbi:hypothetical protein STEG23_001152 [Scotinomys teguina]